jgi:hypothetical protein
MPQQLPGSKTQILMLLCLPLFLGCSAGGGPEQALSLEEQISTSLGVVSEKKGINIILGQDKKTVRYMGLVENKGLGLFCHLEIGFSARGSEGTLIDTAPVRTPINGYVLTILDSPEVGVNQENNSCLKPGETGSFDTGVVNLREAFNDFNFTICPGDDESDPEGCRAVKLLDAREAQKLLGAPEVPCVVFFGLDPNKVICGKNPRVRLSLILPDPNEGHLELNGKHAFNIIVRNDSAEEEENFMAHDITVYLFILNDNGQVIDTARSVVLKAQSCPEGTSPNPLSCLRRHEETEIRPIETNIPVSQNICGGCKDFRIYHSECELIGDTCHE